MVADCIDPNRTVWTTSPAGTAALAAHVARTAAHRSDTGIGNLRAHVWIIDWHTDVAAVRHNCIAASAVVAVIIDTIERFHPRWTSPARTIAITIGVSVAAGDSAVHWIAANI